METGPEYTNPDDIESIVCSLREYFNTGKTRPIEWRLQQLEGLVKALQENEDAWVEALQKDLGAPRFETILKFQGVITDVKHTQKNLNKWMRPKSVSNPWSMYPGSSKVQPEPYGVVCDFIPFNYPMFLGFSTLAPILAAGNVCLFKPSSNTPACAYLYQTLFPKYLDMSAVKIVCGPSSICDKILEQRFDFIFYTGSPRVAHSVMAAASKYLTPVLLELGGKSPVYVDQNVNMPRVATRLVWAKMFNGGQTCVGPDYVLVHQKVKEQFKTELIKAAQTLYPDLKDVVSVINDRHFERLTRAIETSGGNIILEGQRDPANRKMGLTVIEEPKLDSQLMMEEIFGPILPVIEVTSPKAAVDFINSREKPLSLYVLSSDDKVMTYFEQNTSSGSIVQNDCVFQVASADLPFGGVGNSGMGRYHGKVGFQTLSHMKSCMTHSTWIEIGQKFPPYKDDNLNFIRPFI